LIREPFAAGWLVLPGGSYALAAFLLAELNARG
jgi:hypothetical protein